MRRSYQVMTSDPSTTMTWTSMPSMFFAIPSSPFTHSSTPFAVPIGPENVTPSANSARRVEKSLSCHDRKYVIAMVLVSLDIFDLPGYPTVTHRAQGALHSPRGLPLGRQSKPIHDLCSGQLSKEGAGDEDLRATNAGADDEHFG